MFKVGDIVSFGLHGKCMVTSIATKEIASQSKDFYQIKVVKGSTATLKNSSDPSIWVPIDTAAINGLREIMDKPQAESMLTLLSSSDDYFDPSETWVVKQRLLEDSIRKGGAAGLAKVVSHLYLCIKRDAVPPSQVVKLYDSTYKVLCRELAEALSLQPKEADTVIQKALKTKLTSNH